MKLTSRPSHSSLSFEVQDLAQLPPGRLEAYACRHRQPHFEIIWVQGGYGFHKVDDLQYPISAGNIYAIAPGQDHQLILLPGARGFMLSFGEDYFPQGMNDLHTPYDPYFKRLIRQHPEIMVDDQAAEDLADMLKLMIKETQRYSLLRPGILALYLKIFMTSFCRQLESSSPFPRQRTKSSLANAFFTLLEDHFKEERSVSRYANKLFVTPNHLNQIIKTATGYPAKYHIQQRILHEAKKVVHHRSASLKEIAYDLGFADVSHFSKFFKNASGVNFSVFKKHAPDYR